MVEVRPVCRAQRGPRAMAAEFCFHAQPTGPGPLDSRPNPPNIPRCARRVCTGRGAFSNAGMSRRKSYESKPAPPVMDGDERILGVKLREHPSQIPPGYCAGAVNMRFREGVPEPRLGTVHLAWLNNPSASGLGKRTTLYGTGRFRDSAGLVWTI